MGAWSPLILAKPKMSASLMVRVYSACSPISICVSMVIVSSDPKEFLEFRRLAGQHGLAADAAAAARACLGNERRHLGHGDHVDDELRRIERADLGRQP